MKNQKGFSLVELLMSIAIFVAISAVMLANFRHGDYSEELRQSANLMASYLREAQNKSISGKGASTSQGYGINLTSGASNYITYSDTGGTAREYDAGEEVLAVNYLRNVTITTVDMDIFFDIPGGDLYVDGASRSAVLTITLQHSNSTRSMDITVLPFSGQVSVGSIY